MNHKINGVEELNNDANTLYNTYVVGSGTTSADSIIKDLKEAITILKTNWFGPDAGVQINDAIKATDYMIAFRNCLAEIASESSKVACNYRQIQIANGAGNRSELAQLNVSEMSKMNETYTDSSDKVDINPDAQRAKQLIDGVRNNLPNLTQSAESMYTKMLVENWTVGDPHDKMKQDFESVLNSVKTIGQPIFDEVSSHITTAFQNLTF